MTDSVEERPPAAWLDPSVAWLKRNRWKVGIATAALVGGYWWRRARRARRIAVGSVSERWLAEQQFDAGQHPEE